ncbi:MAG: module of ECF transporter [Brockia lithotrophica]|uniref:Module of ECF transporter n=1 Tax=Brockia lithotrophica TaxID=933949 RepID=A0A2T5G6Y8_9BACL|nr:MAG: module of ECF transporter [Brockia lithotrophica]
MKPLVELEDVWFRYRGGRWVLKGVSLRLFPGDEVALIGANGSGKTTLARLLAGLYLPERGTVRLLGQPLADLKEGERARLRRRVAYVFPNPELQIVGPTVEEDVAYSLTRRGFSPAEMRARTEAVLSRFRLSSLRKTPPARLSGGERMRLVLAAAAVGAPVLYILDEATSFLDPPSRKELVEFVRREVASGAAAVWVTHDADLARSVRQVLVLREGQVAPASRKALEERGLPHGRASLPRIARSEADFSRVPTRPRIEFRDVEFAFAAGTPFVRRVFSRLSLRLWPGEVVAVLGPSGAGKSTFARLAAGLLKPSGGELLWDGVSHPRGFPEELRRKIAYVPQFPEDLFLTSAVLDEVAIGLRERGVPPDEAERRAKEHLLAWGIGEELWDRSPRHLSTGERRRTVLAAIFAGEPEVVFLDEPTIGLDASGRALLLDLLSAYALPASSRLLVFVTHDREVAFRLATRVLFLGRKGDEGTEILFDGPPDALRLFLQGQPGWCGGGTGDLVRNLAPVRRGER